MSNKYYHARKLRTIFLDDASPAETESNSGKKKSIPEPMLADLILGEPNNKRKLAISQVENATAYTSQPC